MATDFDTIKYIWPELILVITAALIYVFGAVFQQGVRWGIFALLAFVVAGFTTYRQVTCEDLNAVWLVEGPLLNDQLGLVVRCAMYLVGVLFVIMVPRSETRELTGEVYGSLMLVVVGTMLVAQAGNLVLLFLSLELISIPTYVLLFLGRRSVSAAEATIKYFFLSVLSSVLLLYGFSFLYGLAGTTSLVEIHGVLAAGVLNSESVIYPGLAPIAFMLIMAGLGFKIAIVPFHFYAPDVYQGTTNLNAGLLSVIPKLAGIVVLTRLMLVMAPVLGPWAWQTVMVIAMATMTLGNVSALWQKNVRRMMAFSSIAHAGYMLIGLVIALAWKSGPASQAAISAMLLYLAVYVFASIGTFAAFTWLSNEEHDLVHFDQLAGIGARRPIAAMCLAVFMFSLAGIPPLAGFWGKLFLFWETVRSGLLADEHSISFCFIMLAVVGVVNAAIGAAYYLRLIATMYFPAGDSETHHTGQRVAGAGMAMLFCSLLIVAIGLKPGQIIRTTEKASRAVRLGPRSVENNSLTGLPTVLAGEGYIPQPVPDRLQR